MARFVKTGLFAVTAVVGLTAGLSAASAACKGGICVSGTDDGRTHIVYIESNNLSGFTHYNVVSPGRSQYELRAGQFSFPARPGRKYTYSIQACKRGGFMQSSMCTRWVSFSHTVRE